MLPVAMMDCGWKVPETMTARFMGETCIAKIKAADKKEAVEWMHRRELLADHLEYCISINN